MLLPIKPTKSAIVLLLMTAAVVVSVAGQKHAVPKWKKKLAEFRAKMQSFCKENPASCHSTDKEVEIAEEKHKEVENELIKAGESPEQAKKELDAVYAAKRAIFELMGLEVPKGANDGLFDGDMILPLDIAKGIANFYQNLKKSENWDEWEKWEETDEEEIDEAEYLGKGENGGGDSEAEDEDEGDSEGEEDDDDEGESGEEEEEEEGKEEKHKKRQTLPDIEFVEKKRRRRSSIVNFDIYWGNIWPTAPNIPYAFEDVLTDEEKGHVKAAIKWIEDRTCLRFQEDTTEQYGQFEKLYFDLLESQNSCGRATLSYSSTRKNYATMTKSCYGRLGSLVHEMMHALGTTHEQARPDRDGYVTIHTGKIMENYLGNFEMASYAKAYGTKYDYLSVMHYPKSAFASTYGDITIETKDPEYQSKIGQRTQMSDEDAAGLNAAYCEGMTVTTEAPTTASSGDGSDDTTEAPTTTTTVPLPPCVETSEGCVNTGVQCASDDYRGKETTMYGEECDSDGCQNLDRDQRGPWCNKKGGGWGYCFHQCGEPAPIITTPTPPPAGFDGCVNTADQCFKRPCSNNDYAGDRFKTKRGRRCRSWKRNGYDIPGHKCRNPDNDPNGPWCYYSRTRWDYCFKRC